MEDPPILVRPRRLVRALVALFAALVVAHLVAMVLRLEFDRGWLWGYSDRLNMDAEESFAQFVQMAQLLGIVAVALVIWRRARRRAEPHARAWLAIALVFGYLALDESSRLHELLIVPLQRATGAGGVLFFAWLLVAIPLVVVFALSMLPLLRDLDGWMRRRFLLAGALYLCGVVGMEMAGGWWAERYALDGFYMYVLVPVEEAFEVAGQLLFLFALLVYVARTGPLVTFEVEGEPPAPRANAG